MNKHQDILAHYGVKGMKWGVRRDNKLQQQAKSADKRTKKGKEIAKIAGESKRVRDAGGGLRGTLKVRKEMIETGELSKSDARAGTVRFGRNIALAVLAGAAAGSVTVKSLG